jgi:hemerythrin-like domain-containing protein
MMPIGPLMKEHRLIERMVRLMERELRRTSEKNQANTGFIDVAVDFIRTYADRCHHGKEEDILFRDLAKKQLSAEHERVMNELLEEHVLARKTTGRLHSAKESYLQCDAHALSGIVDSMQDLIELYPAHIEKEDKHFFVPCMGYFSDQERSHMLKEF